VVLKTGWSFGVTLTACVVAYALFRLERLLGLVRHGFGILENNATGSVASSAGFMTGGGNLPAMGALLVLTGLRPDPVAMVLVRGHRDARRVHRRPHQAAPSLRKTSGRFQIPQMLRRVRRR